MTSGTILQFPPDRVRRVGILAGESHEQILIARHKRRIAGRYCKHLLSARAGFVDDVEMRGGVVKALLSSTDGAGEWFPAVEIEPASKSNPR